jgi:hypothetical protein
MILKKIILVFIINTPYDSKKNHFSVYLNKDDSRITRLKKLKKIKKFLSFRSTLPDYTSSYSTGHEFLFPNGIDLKKYLIGVYMDPQVRYLYNIPVRTILEDSYPNVKLFGYDTPNESEYFPKLMDICP